MERILALQSVALDQSPRGAVMLSCTSCVANSCDRVTTKFTP